MRSYFGRALRRDHAELVDSGTVPANAWHTVIAWHDAVHDTINIQVDNGIVNTVSYAGGTADSSNPLSIGAFPNGGTGLDGRIDEVALYKRVLTPEERAWLYNSGQGRVYSEVNLPFPSAVTYGYGDANHDHAVTSLSNGSAYEYDANGNMTKRVIGADTYLLSYDAENRLVEVRKNSVSIASFVYDGDGKRVKSTLNGVTTTFVGSHYEITGSTVTKYYFAGATRVAMRVNGTLTYLFSDHLGSTSFATDANGAKISELRYTAWGEVRYASGTTPTDYTFTGQYSDSYINLLWYGSRHYDPELGRFTSPDTIVPTSAQGVQAWDRYGYVNNNPVVHTDPTGHCMDIASCLQKIPQMVMATEFLADRMLQKGELNLTQGDWEAAADYAAPAIASGSKESTTLTYGVFATWVRSTTLITTDNGDFQVFDETNVDDKTGIPLGGGLPGVSVSATHGLVYGLDHDALNYKGDAVQLNASVPVAGAGGISAEAYVSPNLEVGGVDAGPYLGWGPTILSSAKTYAEPNGAGKISSFLKRILPDRVDGFGLFVCRVASMCGAK